MSEIKKKRLQILLELFGEKIKQKIKTENLDLSEKELLNKFSDYEITESGKYLEWMTKTYIGNGFLYEDLYKVKETLEIFHENKTKLSREKKDIQQYRTLAELWIEVKKFVEQKDDFLSTNEQKRNEKELIYSETEFLYEDDNLRVVAPLTENASKWWGKGTRWCTAADNDNMFHDYFNRAPLLIFDFKDGEKWQLWLNEEEIQFMDENDYEVTHDKIQEKWYDIEHVFLKLLANNGMLLRYLPKKLQTFEFCKMAIENQIYAFPYVAEELRIKELCEIVVKKDGKILFYISENLKTPELCQLAINQDGRSLLFVPDEFKTYELCKIAVQKDGLSLESVSDKYKNLELCKLAVLQNGIALQHVPKNLRTQELCEIAVKDKALALQYVPKNFIGQELCEIAVLKNGLSISYVPKEFRTEKLFKIAIQQNGTAISYVNKRNRTPELYEIAVKQNGQILGSVPEKYRTQELCKIAVEQNGLALESVPHNLKTQDLCKIALKQSYFSLLYIPKDLLTEELRQNFVPKKIKDFLFPISSGFRYENINKYIEQYEKGENEIIHKDLLDFYKNLFNNNERNSISY